MNNAPAKWTWSLRQIILATSFAAVGFACVVSESVYVQRFSASLIACAVALLFFRVIHPIGAAVLMTLAVVWGALILASYTYHELMFPVNHRGY